jgi:hypothetical protein
MRSATSSVVHQPPCRSGASSDCRRGPGSGTARGFRHPEIHDQVPRRRPNPGCGRVSGDTQDADAPGGLLDGREYVQPRSGEGDCSCRTRSWRLAPLPRWRCAPPTAFAFSSRRHQMTPARDAKAPALRRLARARVRPRAAWHHLRSPGSASSHPGVWAYRPSGTSPLDAQNGHSSKGVDRGQTLA